MAKAKLSEILAIGNKAPVITEIQAAFNKLMLAMTGTLAPRLLGLMTDFGYIQIQIVSDGHTEYVSTKELQEIIDQPDNFWKRRYVGYTTAEKMVMKHADILKLYRKLKCGTEHLMKLRNQTESAIDWIDRIGTVGNRQVLIEKFFPIKGKKK